MPRIFGENLEVCLYRGVPGGGAEPPEARDFIKNSPKKQWKPRVL